jgi:general secretion pathway protein I
MMLEKRTARPVQLGTRRGISCSRRHARGFSLLEVMVSIAILGLTLTVILSAQGGLAASNRSAANLGQAVQLGRCKMTETEEKLLKLGYQETDQIDTDQPCCESATPEGFTCDIKVEKIELPNMAPGTTGDGGSILGAPSPSGLPGMTNPAGGPGLNLGMDGGMPDMNMLAGQLGGGAGGAGAEGMLSMVMGMLYPSIKPMYEQSIRRVTITVKWKEGPNMKDLPITQFVTNPARGGFAGSALMADGGAMDFAAPGGSGTPRTPGAPGAGTGGGAVRP